MPEIKSMMCEFTGQDQSCGFRTGAIYILTSRVRRGKGYIEVRSQGSQVCGYGSIEKFLENWNVLKTNV